MRAALLGVLLLTTSALAEELPVTMQVQLLSKMSTYVKNLSGTEVKVLVVCGGAAASRAGQSIATEISQQGKIGSAAATVKVVPFVSTAKFKATVAEEKPQIIYAAPDLEPASVPGVIEAAAEAKVVTISGTESQVRSGIILGFSQVEARPRVLIHLKQAKAQGVEFRNGLVSHAVVVEQ